MDTPTKQRLVGAAVLIALAVIFLPMLVKGPAPDSGVADVPLRIPNEPKGDIETRDLPLIAPQESPSGALPEAAAPAEGEQLPTVDTNAAPDPASQMQPASVAGGEYAVHFGAYATSADADTIVRQLRQSQLPGYREQTTLNGRTAWRVRVGPYATRADAEIARLRAAHVRDDVGARVVVLDADAATPATTSPSAAAPAATASASKPVVPPSTSTVSSEPLPAPTKPVSRPAVEAPKPKPPVEVAKVTKPAAAPVAAPAPAPVAPAASNTGFAVQVGAFGNAAEANRLRDKLRAAGFSAITQSVSSDKGTLTRVRVGPVLTRADADRLKAQVAAKAGVDGIVRPHP